MLEKNRAQEDLPTIPEEDLDFSAALMYEAMWSVHLNEDCWHKSTMICSNCSIEQMNNVDLHFTDIKEKDLSIWCFTGPAVFMNHVRLSEHRVQEFGNAQCVPKRTLHKIAKAF